MYKILFTRQADRVIRRLPRKLATRIRKKLELVAVDPFARNPNVKKLQNRAGYRLRVGDWRVLYFVQEKELVVVVLKIGPRGGVYR